MHLSVYLFHALQRESSVHTYAQTLSNLNGFRGDGKQGTWFQASAQLPAERNHHPIQLQAEGPGQLSVDDHWHRYQLWRRMRAS